MMQLIRDKAQGIVAWIIVAVIAIVFCLSAGSFNSPGSSQVLAKVRGQKIERREVDSIYDRWLNVTSAQKGFNPALLKPDLIKQQITKSLAEQLAIVSMLKRYDLGVGNAMLIDSISGNPDFQENGKFSIQRYKDFLAKINLDEATFEQLRRNELLANQAQHMVVDSSFAFKSEVDRLIAIKNQKRSFGYAIVPAANYATVATVSDAAIDDYYAKNKNMFVLPEKVSLEYIELSLDDLTSQKQISEQEARDYFNKNIQLFVIKDFAKARKTVENSLKRDTAERLFASKGEELANLSFEHPQSLAVASERLRLPIKTTDYFDKRGGTGLTSLPDVIHSAFSESVLVQQHNSDLIRISDDSYVVIRLKDRQAEKQQSLAEVRSQIVKNIQSIDAQAKAKKISEQLVAELKQGKTPKQDWKLLTNVARDAKGVDKNLLAQVFVITKPSAEGPAVATNFQLPNGDYVVVALNKVTDGVLESSVDSNMHEMLAKQVASMNGNLQYMLLQASLIKQADIKYMFD